MHTSVMRWASGKASKATSKRCGAMPEATRAAESSAWARARTRVRVRGEGEG